MTTTQSFKIYETLQRYLNNEDEAKLIIQEIEQVVNTTNVDISLKHNELISKKLDSLKLQLEKEKKFGKTILWIVRTSMGVIFILLIIYKLFLIK